jgi:hypothetical protein
MTPICFDNAKPAGLDDAIAARAQQTADRDVGRIRKVPPHDIGRPACMVADVIMDAGAACACNEAGR